jgi:hypothetical protein
MPVSTTITVVGLKETINALNKVEPQLVKDFKASANKIAEPAISLHKCLHQSTFIGYGVFVDI